MAARHNGIKRRVLIMIASFLLLCQTAFAHEMLGAVPSGESKSTHDVVLFFRYQDSAYLGWETVKLVVPAHESLERMLIEALLVGPRSVSSSLMPLFPSGTRLVNVLGEGHTLFVTFNESFLSPYPDEYRGDAASAQVERRLRRQTALSAIVNTVTENTAYEAVQILVRAETSITGSMRLNRKYLLYEDTTPLPPLTRDESRLLGPQEAAEMLFGAWQRGQWQRVASLTYKTADTGADSSLVTDYQGAQPLTTFLITKGWPSPLDGSCLVVCQVTTLGPDGGSRQLEAAPLRMRRQDGIWRAEKAHVLRLMGIEP